MGVSWKLVFERAEGVEGGIRVGTGGREGQEAVRRVGGG